MAFIVSIGKYGNFYFYRGTSWRLCLGWIAFTWFPRVDGDDILDAAAKWVDFKNGDIALICPDCNKAVFLEVSE